MIYVLAAALFVFLCGAKFVKSGEFNSDYMSKDTTGAINGIFVLLVFMCHISGYMKLGEKLARPARRGDLPVLFGLWHDVLYNEKGYAVCQGYFQTQVPEPFCAF